MLPLMLPLLLSAAPQIGQWLFGGKTAAITQQAETLVTQAVQNVTGTPDAAAAAKVLATNPDAAQNLSVELAKVVAQLQAQEDQANADALKATLTDVANARQQTVDLSIGKSAIAWSAPLVSAIILLAFGTMLYLVMTRSVPEANAPLANLLLGVLGTMAVQVGNYWLGSSAGSAAKANTIEKQLIASTTATATTTPST